MTPDRWQQIEEVFHAALEMESVERSVFLSSLTDGDDELRAEVEMLLTQFDDADSFISQPLLDSGNAGVLSALLDELGEDTMSGTLLGSYRIEREIGRGGMGAVYEAVRADGEFRRKVAIKIVKRGVDTDFVLRRFRNERQVLATLDHPFITRLIDGGTTDDGRPYFVMDYIDGLPLYRFADRDALSISERLALFLRIGEAVEYAHQKRVIHRDLKPSNILVTSDASPRLLDFGIAKLLDPEMSFETLQPTATALRMMTIDYASPEQVRGEKVDFSTDVYSLGVVLYELLTGFRPYRVTSRAPHEIAKAVCEEEPLLPSDVTGGVVSGVPVPVSKSATTILSADDLGKTRVNAADQLRGNLDNILMKALEKEPSKRYRSAAEFCSDIERHIAGKTVDAPQYSSRKRTELVHSYSDDAKLLAVLPLRLLNFSATENTDENYLSIGLADAIISRLTNVRGFTVRPTSSISGYEKNDVDPLQAGRELGVDFVLDGRIKKYGETLRVSLQMLDVSKGSTTWAGQFDEKFSDVLTLEDAISEQVADALVTQVTCENDVKLGKRGTDNPQAYEAYLKGRYHWNQFTADSLPKAIEQFQKAVELDPNYALAHVGVADFYIWANIYGLNPSLESYKQAESAVNRALEIDDQLGEAYATLGLIKQNQFEWQESENLYPKAIELSPNYPNVYEWYSAVLIGSGKVEKGLKMIARAEELDPLSLRTKTLTAWTTYQAQEFSIALAKANEIISLDANYPQGHLQKGYILTEIGDADEAVAEIEKGMSLMPESALAKYYYCFALAAANRLDDARKVWLEMKNSTAYVKPMFVGLASVAVGEIDEAFKYFNQAADEFDPWLVWFGTDAKLKVVHSDKRFLELLKRTKNPIAQRFEQKSDEKKSIAVLPLQFIGEAQTDDAYLAVGLADAMITRLSQVQRIIVRPTNSVLRFAETQDSFAAGHELEVDFVLCGTIRPAGKRIRISAQLIEIKTNTTLWADKFDEEFTEVLELEDKVAEQVAKLLIPQLTAEEEQNLAKRNARNVEAYEAFLRGRYHLNLFTPDNYAQAFEYFQEAVRLDSEYAACLRFVSRILFRTWHFRQRQPS